MDPSTSVSTKKVFFIGFGIVIFLVAGIAGGTLLWRSKGKVHRNIQVSEKQKSEPVNLDKLLSVENKNCAPAEDNSVRLGELQTELKGNIVFYSNSSVDKKTMCVFARNVQDTREKLIFSLYLEKPYQPTAFIVDPSGTSLFYVLISSNLNNAVLRKRDLETGKEEALFTYVNTPDEQQKHHIEKQEDLGNEGIVFAYLQIVNGYLVERIGFDLAGVDVDGDFLNAGIGFGSTQEAFIFKLNNPDKAQTFVKNISINTGIGNNILAVIADKLYLESYIYEGPSDIEVYSLKNEQHYPLGDKFSFANYGVFVISPDSKYIAFSPLIILDKEKKEFDPNNIENRVALINLTDATFHPYQIVSPNCHGRYWPQDINCFELPRWINNTQFITQLHETYTVGKEWKDERGRAYLLNVDGTSKVITASKFESLLKNKSLEELRKEYENVTFTGGNNPIGWLQGNSTHDVIDSTQNWKTYRNEEYGFEFQYSRDFSVKEGHSGVNNRIFTVRLHDETNYKLYDGPGAGGSPIYFSIGVEARVEDAGITCNEGRWEIMEEVLSPFSDAVCILPGNYFGQGESMATNTIVGDYQFTYYADFYDKNKLAINKILSTFKFIES